MNLTLNKVQKGILLLATGTVLLLYSTGLITKGLNVIFILTSLLMLAFGFYLVDGPQQLRRWIQRLTKNGTTQNTRKENSKTPEGKPPHHNATTKSKQVEPPTKRHNNSTKGK